MSFYMVHGSLFTNLPFSLFSENCETLWKLTWHNCFLVHQIVKQSITKEHQMIIALALFFRHFFPIVKPFTSHWIQNTNIVVTKCKPFNMYTMCTFDWKCTVYTQAFQSYYYWIVIHVCPMFLNFCISLTMRFVHICAGVYETFNEGNALYIDELEPLVP